MRGPPPEVISPSLQGFSVQFKTFRGWPMLARVRGRSNSGAIPPTAIVQFEAVTLMVDERMRWEKVAG